MVRNATNQDSVDCLIIGAGLCGLYAALTLARAGKKVVVLEKEDEIGGLAAGVTFDGNFCDFGVHMLHASNPEVFEDCAAMMGEERIEVGLDARIKWGSGLCRYPLRPIDMFKAMPLALLVRCVAGLVAAESIGRGKRQRAENAEQALIAYYGKPLYRYFFEEFTTKYWGIHPKELSAEFIRRKMPRLSAIDLVRKCIPGSSKASALVESALEKETLHYSKSGAETLPRRIAAECERLGVAILTGQRITSVTTHGEGVAIQAEELWQAGSLINTAPLPVFFKMLDQVPREVQSSAQSLRYKPTVVYGLLVHQDRCMQGLYTYYRDRVFHRVGEPKNAGLVVQPQGHTLLIVETTCTMEGAAWKDDVAFRQQIVRDLVEENLLQEGDIVAWKHLKNSHGYPVYQLGYEKDLKRVQHWLAQQPRLHSAGRQGAFSYPAMHTAMQMGKDTAEVILTQQKGS